MKKLFLILCVVGSLAVLSCSDAVDCSCVVKETVPELNLVGTMNYSMNGYEGECSDITVETLGLSMQIAEYQVHFEVTCSEK
ncbi:MAG: hypothetical protein LBO06_04725 [Bacteroidales bacterium]|jgi:hypothetical protein|nr:hypothetical protein [Bacteroidales bacterium]